MFPLSKYHFHTTPDNKVIAVSTYAGKTVRGVAKCDSRDTFSQEKGQELAAARCAAKVAKKRLKRAGQKFDEAYEALLVASEHFNRMEYYLKESKCEYREAVERVEDLQREM